jgi:hypothetical protein
MIKSQTNPIFISVAYKFGFSDNVRELSAGLIRHAIISQNVTNSAL